MASSKLIVHGVPLSQPWRAVVWPLLIKRVPFTNVMAVPGGAGKLGTSAPTFLAKFPTGTVPAIEAPCGTKITEAAAILTFLADTHGWDDLYPKELSARARVDEYLHWHHGGIRTLAKAYMSPRVRLDKKQPDPEGIKELEKAAHRAVSLVESGFLGRGDGSQFVAGTAAPTVADFLCYSEVASLGPKYGQVLDLSPEEFPRVNRWLNDMAALPYHDETFTACAHLGDLKQEKLTGRLAPATKAGLNAITGAIEKMERHLAASSPPQTEAPPIQQDIASSRLPDPPSVTTERRGVKFADTPPSTSISSVENDSFMGTHNMSTPKIDRGSAEFRAYGDNRRPVADCVAPQESSLQRPDFEDNLRRVSAVVHRHIEVCSRRRQRARDKAPETMETGQFHESAAETFAEWHYASPQYKMRFVRLPLGRPGAVYAMQEVDQTYASPNASDIYHFISTLFNQARLSSECSIVCLIYVERLMEKGNVPLLPETWRPILLCGLLLSHKVWQDHACWNIEVAQVYPQFSLAAINRLEKRFLERIKWDLYIKQSLYAQYYFGLRSLSEQRGFRQRYNATVMAPVAPHMDEVQQRSGEVKKEALQLLSKSM